VSAADLVPSHPSREEWDLFLAGRLGEDDRQRLAGHLVACLPCRTLVSANATDSGTATPPSPSSSWSRRDEIIARFEAAWATDREHLLDEFLAAAGTDDPLLLTELVHVDLEFLLKAGKEAHAEDYLRRYPALARNRDVALDLIVSEFRLRQRRDGTGDLDAFCSRFPAYEEELRRRLTQLTSPAAELSPTRPAAGDAPLDPFFGALPRAFGRYRILRRLGEGAMGTVYLAHDAELDRQVALKVARDGAEEGIAAERFQREARAAASLRHEGLCRVLDFGTHDGTRYLTMEYIPGRPLSGLLAEPFEPRRAADLVRRIALAMDAAHRQGVLHRDLKPANIVLDDDGRPTVVDFGLARRHQDPSLTHAGTTLGTPLYMSPEQAAGASASRASDVYSLGVVLYQLLTGRLPFTGGSADTVLARILHGEPPPPSAHCPGLDPRLEGICRKAMARDATARHTTMADLAADLDAYLRGGPAPVPTPARKQGRWLAAGSALGLVALAAVLALGLSGLWRPGGAHPDPGTASPPFRGLLDVLVWEKGNSQRTRLRLHQDGALPLRVGDRIRIEASLNRPGYLYVLWIAPEGTATPLYPWTPGHWEQRPEVEERLGRLGLPRDPTRAASMPPGMPGMDTLLLLVRDSPLPADVAADLPRLLADLPRQQQQNSQAAVWFQDWEVLRDVPERAAPHFDDQDLDDSVLLLQRLLKERLQPHFVYSRAVSFATGGP
jgi:hypothetical protein